MEDPKTQDPNKLITGDPNKKADNKNILGTDEFHKALNESLIEDGLDRKTDLYPGENLSREHTFDYDKFTPYIKPDQMFGDFDLQKIRAQKQTTLEQLWNGAKTTALSVPVGILEQVGYLGAGFEYAGKGVVGQLKANEMDFSNGLVEWAQQKKEGIKEDNPVYRDNPTQTLDWTDPAFYIENIGGVVESIGEFYVLGQGTASSVSKSLEFLKIAKLGKYGEGLAKILNLSIPAVALAYVEGAQTATGTYQTLVQKNIQAANDKFMKEDGTVTDQEAYDLAIDNGKREAGLAAATTAALNTILVAPLNLTGIASLGKFNQLTRNRIGSLVAEDGFESLGKEMRNAFLREGPQEYFEEDLNLFSEKYGLYRGEEALGMIPKHEKKSLVNILVNSFASEEGFLNGILGYIGGVGQHSAVGAFQKGALAEKLGTGKSYAKLNEEKVQAIKDALENNDELLKIVLDAFHNKTYNDSIKNLFNEYNTAVSGQIDDFYNQQLEDDLITFQGNNKIMSHTDIRVQNERKRLTKAYADAAQQSKDEELAVDEDDSKLDKHKKALLESISDLTDQRLFNLFINSFNAGTAEHLEDKIDAYAESVDEKTKPAVKALKDQFLTAEKYYREGMRKFDSKDTVLAVPEYVHDKLKLTRLREQREATSEKYQSELAKFYNANLGNASTFINNNNLNTTANSLLDYVTKGTPLMSLNVATFSQEDMAKVEQYKQNHVSDLIPETNVQSLTKLKSEVDSAERNFTLASESFNSNWKKGKETARNIHNLKQKRIDDYIETENNKSNLTENQTDNKKKNEPKPEDPKAPIDPDDEIINEDEEDDDVFDPGEEAKAANEAELNKNKKKESTDPVEVSVVPKTEAEKKAEEKKQKEAEKKATQERRAKEKAEREKKTNKTENGNESTKPESAEVVPDVPDKENTKPAEKDTIQEKKDGESSKKKPHALSVANRALNVTILPSGQLATAFNEAGSSVLNESSKEATKVLAKPFKGVKTLTFEVDTNWVNPKDSKDTFESRKNDLNRIPIKILMGDVVIGYVHDVDKIHLHVYDDLNGNLQNERKKLINARTLLFNQYKNTGSIKFTSKITNQNKSHGSVTRVNSLTSLKDAFSGEDIKIGVVQDSANHIITRDGIHRTNDVENPPKKSTVVAILPSAKSLVENKTGGITRYLKLETVGGINHEFSENVKKLMVDAIVAIVNQDETFLAALKATYGEEIQLMTGKAVTNSLQSFKGLCELFFYVQKELRTEGTNKFYIGTNNNSQTIHLNDQLSLNLKDLKNLDPAALRKTVDEYIRANMGSKYFNVNAKLLGRDIAFPVYKDGKLQKPAGKVSYEKEFLNDTRILQADFKGLKLDESLSDGAKGNVIFYTDSVIEFGMPEANDPKSKQKQQEAKPKEETKPEPDFPWEVTNTEPIIEIGVFPITATDVTQIDQSNDASDVSHWGSLDFNATLEVEESNEDFQEEIKSNEVNYKLRVVETLLNLIPIRNTIRLNTKNNPYIETNLKKELAGKGVPSNQISFIFDYMRAKGINQISTEELVMELALSYSYNVEINTAKGLQLDSPEYSQYGIKDFRLDGVYYQEYEDKYYKNDGSGLVEITKVEFTNAENKIDTSLPTQYYSNLTVPGGINYKELEISTPNITPNIKGHASFSTDNGIGWFRSDEQSFLTDFQKEGLTKDEIAILAKRGQGSKTRRVLELQSDLFQKGRDNNSLTAPDFLDNLLSEEEFKDKFPDHSYTQYLLDNKDNKPEYRDRQNDFLQLLNKDGKWIEFFVRSIIQDSAKKGYEKLLFPSGETAAKVEGHETLANEIISIDKRLAILHNTQSNDSEDRIKFDSTDENNKPVPAEYTTLELANEITKLEARKQELKSQGIEKLKPIENFYENRVKNVLDKAGYNPTRITDEYGNDWFEVTITEKQKEQIFLSLDLTSDDSLIKDEKNEYFIQVGTDGSNNPTYLGQQQQIDVLATFTNLFVSELYKGKTADEAFETVRNAIKSHAEFAKRPVDQKGLGDVLLGKVFDALYDSFYDKHRASVKSLITNSLPDAGLKLVGDKIKSKGNTDGNILEVDLNEESDEVNEVYEEISNAQNNKFGNDSSAIDIFSKASQRVKRLLGYLKVPNKFVEGEAITYKRNWAALPMFLEKKKVYNQLLEAIGDSQSLEEMKSRLYQRAKDGRMDFYSVLLALNAADQTTQNEFFSVLAQQYNTYSELTRKTEKRKGAEPVQEFKRQDKNRNLESQPIIDNWNNNAKLLLYQFVDGKPVINVPHINSLKKDFDALVKKTENFKGWKKEDFDSVKDDLGRILRSIGINVDNQFLEDYYRDLSRRKIRANPISEEFNKVYPTFKGSLEAIGFIIDDLKITDRKGKIVGNYDNPFKNASGRMFDLAEVEFLSGKYDVNSSFRMHKKGYYSYNSPFALRDLVDRLKRDEHYVNELRETAYAKSSYILRMLSFGENNPSEEQLRFIRNFDAIILGGVRHTIKGNKSTEISDLSPREREIANVNMLMAGFRFRRIGNVVTDDMNGTGQFVANTISDKITLPMFPVNLLATADDTLSGRLLDELYSSAIQSELNRMQLINEQVNGQNALPNERRVLGTHYAKDYKDQKGLGFFFLNFDYLNLTDESRKLIDTDKISKEENLRLKEILYIYDNRLNEKISNSSEYQQRVKDSLKEHFKIRTENKIQDWIEQDIVEVTADGMRLGDNFDNNIKQEIRAFLTRKGKSVTPDAVVRYAAMFYEATQQFWGTEIALITDDPATEGKPVFDEVTGLFDLSASIKATTDNINKRNAKWIAPGLRGNFTDPFYIELIATDVKSKLSEYNPAEYAELIDELNRSPLNQELRDSIIGKYEDIKVVDGQEIITVREHLNNLHAYGMIDEVQLKAARRILVKDKPSIDDFEELATMSIVLEPWKHVYAKNLIEDGHNLPKYIKTSAFPLIPFLTKGTKWDAVRKKMEAIEVKHNMPVRLTFPSGAKLGVKGKPFTLFDKNGNPVDSDYESSMMILDRQGLYLQQQPQETKNKITQGTQETILNLQNFQTHDKGGNEYIYDVAGIEVKATDFVALYNTVHSNIIEQSFNQLLKDLKAKQGTNGIAKINSIGALRDVLTSELKSRGVGLNSISALTTLVNRESKKLDKIEKEKLKAGESEETVNAWKEAEYQKLLKNDRFLLPLILHPQAKKLESVMLSTVTNNAIRLKLPGTSGILGTEIGFELDKKTEYNHNGVAWIDKTRSGPLKKNEIILSWWFGNSYAEKVELYNAYKEGKVSIKDLETFYGFRIPTSSPSYTTDLKVAGFFPPVAGSLAIPSRRLTIAMGSDFDVDTLKMYQHNYTINLKRDDNGNIQDAKVNKVDYNEELDLSQMTKKQLQNLAIDLRLALTTHPSRQLGRVLPSAFGKFEQLAKQFADKYDPILGVSALSSINNRNAFFDGQGGKAGIARFALLTVGHTKSQLANIYIRNNNGGIKFLNEDGSLIEEDDYNKDTYSFLDEDGEQEIEPSGLWRLDKVESLDGNLISNIIQYLASGAVDNVKELILRANNINKETFGVAGLLAQVGLNEEQIVYFLKQPVIVNYTKEAIKLTDSFNEEYNPNARKELVNKMYQEYAGVPNTNPSNIVGFSLTNLKEMLDTQTLNSSVSGYNQAQADILNAFIYYNELATDYNKVMSGYRQESKGVGKSVIEHLRIIDNFDSIPKISSIGNKSGLDNLYYKTYQDVIDQTEELFNTTENGNPILHSYSNVFREVSKNIYSLVDRDAYNERFSNDISNAIVSYYLTALTSITSDSRMDRQLLLLDRYENADKVIIDNTDTIVQQYYKLPDYTKENKFLKQLQFYKTEEGFNVVKNDNTKMVDNIDDIHVAFISLLTDQNLEVQRFAKNLVKYSFITGGNPFNPTGFHKYIPASYLIDNRIGEDFYKLDLNEIGSNFYEQFFQNNPNYAIHFKLSNKSTTFNIIGKKEDGLIKINTQTKEKEILSRYATEGEEGWSFKEFISEYNGKEKTYKLYKLISSDGIYQKINNYFQLPIEVGDIYDFNRPIEPSILETVAPTESQLTNRDKNAFNYNFDIRHDMSASELVKVMREANVSPAMNIVFDALSQIDSLNDVKIDLQTLPMEGATAAFYHDSKAIRIKPDAFGKNSKTRQANIIAEEIVHAATVKGIKESMQSNSDKKVLYERTIRIKKVIEARFNEVYEKEFKAIKNLDPNNTGTDYVSAMKYYFDVVKNKGISLGEQKKNLNPDLVKILNEGFERVYPLNDEFEFIAQTLSNETFQNFLKDQKYTGDKSIFEVIFELIAELISSISGKKLTEAYGDIDNTLLRQALEVAFSYTLGTNQQEFKKKIDAMKQEQIKPDGKSQEEIIDDQVEEEDDEPFLVEAEASAQNQKEQSQNSLDADMSSYRMNKRLKSPLC